VNAPASLLIATRNEGKLIEVQQLLSDLPMRLISLNDFPKVKTIEETGSSFTENAALKAAGYAVQTGVCSLADDSGLEVDALGGAPGVLSARFAGEGASDRERVKRLLDELDSVDSAGRSARFVSAVAIASGDGEILNLSVGACPGRIAFTPRGLGGFGYDPIFVPQGSELSFGELTAQVKNRISHRAHALDQAHHYLLSLTRASGAG